MTSLLYNGIRLENVGTETVLLTPIYAGPNYLYTQVTLTITATFRPGRDYVGYKEVPNSVDASLASVRPSPGAPGALTLRLLRQRLLVPRRPLVYKIGDRTVFESPTYGATALGGTDASHGPKPLHLRVDKVLGSTIWVTYAIQFATLDCVLETKNPSPLRSHLYTASITYDEQMYAVRETRGRMVFDVAHLQAIGWTADRAFNEFIKFTQYWGFQRYRLARTVSADGSYVDYQFLWRESKNPILNQAIISQIDCVYRKISRFGGLMNGFLSTATDSIGALGNVASASAMGAALGHVGTVVGAGTSLVANTSGVVANLVNQLPTATWDVLVIIKGMKGAGADQLSEAANRVASLRLFGVDDPALLLLAKTFRGYHMTETTIDHERTFILQIQIPGNAIVDVFLRTPSVQAAVAEGLAGGGSVASLARGIRIGSAIFGPGAALVGEVIASGLEGTARVVMAGATIISTTCPTPSSPSVTGFISVPRVTGEAGYTGVTGAISGKVNETPCPQLPARLVEPYAIDRPVNTDDPVLQTPTPTPPHPRPGTLRAPVLPAVPRPATQSPGTAGIRAPSLRGGQITLPTIISPIGG